MTLVEKVGDFLRALDHTVEAKDRHFLLAEQPGLGGERDQHFVWVLTRDMRQHRPGPVVEDEYLTRFKGIAEKHPGARLHLIVDTTEGLSQEFRTNAKRLYGVSIQVPAQFFDLEFKYEVARNSASAVADLVREAEAFEIKRVPQAYARDGADSRRPDIVPDLLAEIDAALPRQDAFVWFIVAPAGSGKSTLFASLFAQLYRKFLDKKRSQLLYPRPFPMIASHLREAAGHTIMGLIDAFMRTDFAAPATRHLFNWMIDNRHSILMLDGLDEVITRDESFLKYLEDRITTPGASPLILISVRDSLFRSSDQLAGFLDYYQSICRVFTLKAWDNSAQRLFTWIQLTGRAPRDGEHDTAAVTEVLQKIRKNPKLQRLAATPFYADLLVKHLTMAGATLPADELGLLDLAVTEMCRREYGKGILNEALLPLASLREWLEELAAAGHHMAGFSVSDLRELADLVPVFASRELEEDEKRALVEQIQMAPFLTQSAASGRLEFTHEILAEYLAGCRYAREFSTNSPLFSSRLSQRAWAPDSLILPLLARVVDDNIDRLLSLADSSSLPMEGFRNLIQILAFVPGGERFLRAGRLSLEGTRLNGVRLRGLNLDGVSFRRCDLTSADFTGSSLQNTRFEGALLENTVLIDIPKGGLDGAAFGNCEHFDSVIVSHQKRLEDVAEFQAWLSGQSTVIQEPTPGPCPTSRQLLHLFRKFILVDGQGRRDVLDTKGIVSGRQVSGAPPYTECVDATLAFGYLEQRDGKHIGRVTGPKYGETVTFVKSQRLSPGLSSLLDSLCRVPNCPHVSSMN